MHRLPEKYGFSGWVWILAAVGVVGFLGLGSYLVQTQQRLKAVEIELESAKQAAEAEIEKQIARLKEEIAWERQALQSQVESLTQAVNQRKVEAAEREKQIAKLRQGIASCEEFFNEWEVQNAGKWDRRPASGFASIH